MIFKLQRPLNRDGGPWLLYNESREVMMTVDGDLLPEDVIAAMGRDPKGYFEGSIKGTTLILESKVRAQNW